MTEQTENELLRAALQYIGFGWKVFPIHTVREGGCSCGGKPCHRPAKHPIGAVVPNGLKDATGDPDQARAWWGRYPDANIGIVTGEASGFVVVDIDTAGDKIGDESLDNLESQNGPLPDTVEQITGSGGRHILLKHPGDTPISNSTSKLGQDIDIRGDGGYIIAPPSLHVSGRRYEWEGSSEPGEIDIAIMPAWLIALTRRRAASKQTPATPAHSEPLPPKEVARIREALRYLDVEDRDDWLLAGMALHSTGAANAYEVWEQWSSQSGKFDAADQARVWNSFTPGGLSLASLFAAAKKGGYVPPGQREQPPHPADSPDSFFSPEGTAKARNPAELSEGYEAPGADASGPPFEDSGGPAPSGHDWKVGFIRNKSDNSIKANPGNVELVFRHDPEWQGVLSYCLFSNRIFKLKEPPYMAGTAGEWDDSDTAQARVWMTRKYRFCGSDSDTVAAALVSAKHHGTHPVREYLEGLAWDGTERIAELFLDLGAAGEGEYLRLVSLFWFVGAVKRIFEPGCKNDYMLVFEGRQGQGKSSWARVLGGQWFSDAPIPLGEKDAYQNIQGVWIQELAELASLNKSDSYQAKQFITQAVDRYRPSYGRFASQFPRQSVLFGSTNDRVWLRDTTGGRRFWPVLIPDDVQVDVSGLEARRDQYWAEAMHLYRAGAPTFPDWETEQRLFVPEQEARMQGDTWEDRIIPWLEEGAGGEETPEGRPWIEVADVFEGPLSMVMAIIQKGHEMRVAAILQKAGWEKKRLRLQRSRETAPKQRRCYIGPMPTKKKKEPF